MDATKTVAALSALAHEHRLAIYRMLVQHGPNGLPAGTIAERLAVPPSSLTFHLHHLFRAGLVTQRRLSRQIVYAADFTAMNDMLGYLTENCCQGNPAACGLPAAARAPSTANTGVTHEAPACSRIGR